MTIGRSLGINASTTTYAGYPRWVQPGMSTTPRRGSAVVVSDRPPAARDRSAAWLSLVALTVFGVLVVAPGPGTFIALAICGATVALMPRRIVIGGGAALIVALLINYPSRLVAPDTRAVLIFGVCVLALITLVRSPKRTIAGASLCLVSFYLVVTLISHTVGAAASSTSATLGNGALVFLAGILGACFQAGDLKTLSRVVVNLGVLQTILGLLTSPFPVRIVLERVSASDPDGTGIYSFVPQPNLILHGDFLRVSGSVGHPLPYALFLLFGIVLLCLGSTKYGPRRVLLLSIVLGVGMLLSGSRSTIAAGLLAACLMLLVSKAKSPYMRVFKVAAVPVAAATFVFYLKYAIDNAQTYSVISLTHRVGALDSFRELMNRSFDQLVLGWGPASIQDLEASGLVHFEATLSQYDNQYVTTFALLGVVGLAVLLVVMCRAMLHGNAATRALAVVFAFMFLSFDALSWVLFAFLFWSLMMSIIRDDEAVPDQGDRVER